MEVENVNIFDLVPSQIIDLINKLEKTLKVIKVRRKTISKVACFEKEQVVCPHCESCNIVKNGHTKTGVQTYKCKECKKKFNDLTGTVFANCHLNYEQIEIFLQCFRDRISIKKTAERMGVNKNTVHLLRLKVLDSLSEIRKNTVLNGETTVDEIYETINLKGTKKENMPRHSKPRKSNGTTKRGINAHKVCIETACDEYDNCFLEIVGTGPITSDMVKESLTPKIGKVTKLITDCKSSYESEAKLNNWNLIQIKSKGHVDKEGNSLANINSIHSGLSVFLTPFHGVSTKHLQGYLDWYMFDKFLNYSYEENSRNKILLNNTMIRPTSIKTSNMYDNYSGIDFDEVYLDYGYIPSPTN